MTILRMLGVAGLCWAAAAQQAPKKPEPAKPAEGTRELFYLAVSEKERLPPIRKTVALSRPQTSPMAPGSQSPPAAAPPPVVHLGLRYNLVLVNPDLNKSEPVEAEHTFRAGDCVQIDFESNRSGYLYVLAKQSGGAWKALLPSPEMADQTNVIDPGHKMRVPADYCFELHNPPGEETLFVVLSRDPRDFFDLYDGIRKQNEAPPSPAAPSTEVHHVEIASLTVNKAVAHMAEQFGTRDIEIRKINQPVAAGEAPGSVYAVSDSSKPASSLAVQIVLRHR